MAQLNYDNNTQSNIRIGKCSRCNSQIQNPAKSKRPETLVCKNCTHFSKFGESLFETEQRKLRAKQAEYKSKQKETLKTQIKPISLSKPRAKVKHVSEKQKVINAEISNVKLELIYWAVDNGQFHCTGCGRANNFILDCSHRLSVKHHPKLATDLNNICLYCRKCHIAWESWDLSQMIELNNFVESVEYIYNHDNTTFQKTWFKLLDYYESNPTTKVKNIIKKIENFENFE